MLCFGWPTAPPMVQHQSTNSTIVPGLLTCSRWYCTCLDTQQIAYSRTGRAPAPWKRWAVRWALHLVLHLHPSLHLHTVAFPTGGPLPLLSANLSDCLSVRPAVNPLSLAGCPSSELRPTPKRERPASPGSQPTCAQAGQCPPHLPRPRGGLTELQISRASLPMTR